MIEVVNKRDCVESGLRFYVGRPSPLGNPLVVGRDGTRADVIEGYRSWLQKMIFANDTGVMCALGQIEIAAKRNPKIELVCWCAPLSCHADVLAEVIQRRIDTGRWSVSP